MDQKREENSNVSEGSDVKMEGFPSVSSSKRIMLPVRTSPGNMKILKVPILRPKMKAVVKKAPRPSPIIEMIDKEKQKEKRPFFTEIDELRKEYGIPDSFNSKKPTTMCDLALSEKLQVVQRLRGENKFLEDNIRKNRILITNRETAVHQFRRSTVQLQGQCQILQNSIQTFENEIRQFMQ